MQGPGAPNLDLDGRSLASDTLDRYRTLAHLARTIAREEGALFVERWDSVTREFYLSGSIKPQTRGHALWGSLLAEQLRSLRDSYSPFMRRWMVAVLAGGLVATLDELPRLLIDCG